MATIRQLGDLPCPRCKIPLVNTRFFGTKQDRKDRERLERGDCRRYRHIVTIARAAILGKDKVGKERNYAVDSAYVERLLKPESLVPTLVRPFLTTVTDLTLPGQNAFSDPNLLGLNFFGMFLVDLMHEVELGVWKALLIHLLRILESLDGQLLNELDYR